MHFQELIDQVRSFNHARGWDTRHRAHSLLIALVSEVGELADQYKWRSVDDVSPEFRESIAEELSDVLIYLICLALVEGIDLENAAQAKLAKNASKYPSMPRDSSELT